MSNTNTAMPMNTPPGTPVKAPAAPVKAPNAPVKAPKKTMGEHLKSVTDGFSSLFGSPKKLSLIHI